MLVNEIGPAKFMNKNTFLKSLEENRLKDYPKTMEYLRDSDFLNGNKFSKNTYSSMVNNEQIISVMRQDQLDIDLIKKFKNDEPLLKRLLKLSDEKKNLALSNKEFSKLSNTELKKELYMFYLERDINESNKTLKSAYKAVKLEKGHDNLALERLVGTPQIKEVLNKKTRNMTAYHLREYIKHQLIKLEKTDPEKRIKILKTLHINPYTLPSQLVDYKPILLAEALNEHKTFRNLIQKNMKTSTVNLKSGQVAKDTIDVWEYWDRDSNGNPFIDYTYIGDKLPIKNISKIHKSYSKSNSYWWWWSTSTTTTRTSN